MDAITCASFSELSVDEMQKIDGGGWKDIAIFAVTGITGYGVYRLYKLGYENGYHSTMSATNKKKKNSKKA